MKKLLYCCILSFVAISIATAMETIALSYKGIQTLPSYNIEHSYLAYDSAYYVFDVPYIELQRSIPSSTSRTYFIENPKFQTLSAAEQVVAEQIEGYLPSTISFSQKTDAHGQSATLTIMPFILQNGEVLRLTSFELHHTDVPILRTALTSATETTTSTSTRTSVLSRGSWHKIRIPETGVYKITYNDIVNMGLNPDDVCVFGYGGNLISEDFSVVKFDDLPQLPVYIHRATADKFTQGDYILFYGLGPVSWTFGKTYNGEYSRVRNPYSDYGYYFLASGTGVTRTEIPEVDYGVEDWLNYNTLTTYLDHVLYENDLVSICNTGREFYGEEFNSATLSRRFPFSIPDLTSTAVLKVRAYTVGATMQTATTKSSFSVTSSTYPDKQSTISPTNFSDDYDCGRNARVLYEFPASSVSDGRFNIDITFSPALGSSRGWLDLLMLTVRRDLILRTATLPFRDPSLSSNSPSMWKISGATSSTQVWEITSPTQPQRVKSSYDNGVINAFVLTPRQGDYIAVTVDGTFPTPQFLGRVEHQNIHAETNPDMVILTHPDFLSAAERLADAHRRNDNMKVFIVTPEPTYNEFSSGTPDASAYRYLMKMFYDRYLSGEDSRKPRYLLLFGDGSFDNRQILSNPDGHNKLLTYQSYNSNSEASSYVFEDYFGFLDSDDYGEADNALIRGTVDIGIGRIAVNTLSEADGVVDKLIRYMENPGVGKWRNQLLYLADDGNSGTHLLQSDVQTEILKEKHPEFQIDKYYMDAYTQVTLSTGERYPELREKLLNRLSEGVLYFNYIGHGGTNGITNEQMLLQADISNLKNSNYPLWLAATCDLARFDRKGDPTLGEVFFLNPNGGGIGCYSTARTVYMTPNFELNKAFTESLFDIDPLTGERYRIGDLVRLSKVNCQSTQRANKMTYFLSGDPALRLQVPTYTALIDSINGTLPEDADLHALSQLHLKGHIADQTDSLTLFNGIAYITLYDKESTFWTQNNDNDSSGPVSYLDRNILYQAKAEVVDGAFSLKLIIPRDIQYTDGAAKILIYATDETHMIDAHGFSEFSLGGIEESGIEDDNGPQVSLYLNTVDFRSGDQVPQRSLLYAQITDENGINVSSAGLGHDLVLSIDGEDWITINDYFELDLNSYSSGTVRYHLPELSEGHHTLTLRVWDLAGNSTSVSTEFVISDTVKVHLLDVHCYPNPASDYVIFAFRHDRPNDELTATIHVFDLSGREVWSIEHRFDGEFSLDGNYTELPPWDLHTAHGARLSSGMYLYHLELEGELGKKATTNKKLMILP